MEILRCIPRVLILLCCCPFAASAGTVVGWGNNSYGQLNIPENLTNAAAIASGHYHNLALKSDTTVVGWGLNDAGQTNISPGLSNVVEVAAGGNFSLALKSDGTVIGWGAAPAGLASLSNVTAIAGGEAHMLALKEDGTVVALGDNAYNQCTVPAGLSNVVAIGAGRRFSCALTSDGNVTTWGTDNINHQLEAPQTGRGVNLVAYAEHGLMLTAEGLFYPWGDSYVSSFGSYSIYPPIWYPGAGTGDAAVIGNGGNHFLGASINGAPMAWGYNASGQLNIPPGVSNVVAMTGGLFHSIALIGDGSPQFANRRLGLSLLPGNTVASSETVTLHIAAVGQAPLTYYWLLNGSNFLTSTSPKLSFTNVLPAQAGTYSVIVSNSLGSIQGSNQVLSVLPLKLVAQPVSQNIYEAGDASFSVNAVGTALNYHWRFNGDELPGETNATLNLAVVATNQAGQYSVVVNNSYGTLLSSNAQLTVTLPSITSHPGNQTTNAGVSVLFTVSAVGTALHYQWLFNGTNLPAATNLLLALPTVNLDASGTYQLRVSNAYRVLESSNALLTVVPLTITTQPTNRTAYSGGFVLFNVVAQGTGPFTYQWRYENANLTDATNATLTLTSLTVGQSGNYSVLVSNDYGAVLSSNAMLTVSDTQPIILTQPRSVGSYPGLKVSFQVTADGSNPLTYQWLYNDSEIIGATNPTLTLSNLTALPGSYSVRVSNPVGFTLSSNALLSFLAIVSWGNDQNSGLANIPADLTNVLAITAGSSHSVALKSNGRVVAWGDNNWGQTNTPANLSNVVAIAAGYNHTLALKTNGTVVSWGDMSTTPAGLTNVIAVAAGDYHSLALNSNRTVVAWGSGSATNVPAGLTNVIAIAAGGAFSAALKADKTVVAWGSAPSTTGMTNVVSLSANEFPLAALKADGRVVSTWVSVPASLSNVVAVAAGRYHVLALKSNGTVTNLSTTPATPAGLSNVIAIASGQNHCLAIITGEPPAQVPVTDPIWNTNNFSFTLPTLFGRVYALEYKNSLLNTNWTALLLEPGNGGSLTLKDTAATNAQRFYRVRQW